MHGTKPVTTATVRAPAMAGTFYPSDPNELGDEVRGLLGEDTSRQTCRGLVCPHAGYIYSGGVTGATYARAEIPRRVVVLGPNHTGKGVRGSVYARGAWSSPFGEVPVDEAMTAALLDQCGLLQADIRAHTCEHAIEVQLPFLQVLRPDVTITPITLARYGFKDCVRIGEALADAVASTREDVLVVASTDMSHFESAASSRRRDWMAIERMLDLDAEGLHDVVEREEITMCGYVPTTVMLTATRILGAGRAELVQYTNSGEVTGDLDEVVAYAGLTVQ